MSYQQHQSNPYHSGPGAEASYGNQGRGYGGEYGGGDGYGNGSGNGYSQPEQHEMQPYGQPAASHVLSQQDFLSRISAVRNEIRALTAEVREIAGLHQRALSGSDPNAQHALDSLVSQTQLRNTSIRDQIRSLKADVERTTDGTRGLKTRQWESLNGDFKKELQNYLNEERQYKERYREQIARQYRIVNPGASDQEVRQVVEADSGEGIFQQALLTNRSGQATAVLGAVRARHNELQQIEQSIAELGGLFQDLDTLVIQQDQVIQHAEGQTEQIHTNLNKGNVEVGKGIESARRARKLKWWCLLVVILIIIAIALGVGLGIYLGGKGAKTATS